VNKDVTLNVRKGKYCETTKQQHSKNNNDNDRNQQVYSFNFKGRIFSALLYFRVYSYTLYYIIRYSNYR
jgi:hypothetical protein